MRIAVFDPVTLSRDPAGSCVVRAVSAAADSHQITVFSGALEDSLRGRVRFVRVPSVARPQVARYVSFKLMANLLWVWERFRGRRYDVVQATETCVGFATLVYVHFCHNAYLQGPGRASGRPSLRSLIRRSDHVLRARPERRIFRRASVVAVSDGLARELTASLQLDPARVSVVPNPVDIASFAPPADFDRLATRISLGVGPDQLLLTFVALGHFERKGLPEALESLGEPGLERLSLVVVGGEPDLLAIYQGRIDRLGLSDRVHLTGFAHDIRSYLWASDAYLLPSRYETFSLALHQAAAAGLPLLSTDVHGARELVTDGEQGIVMPLVSGTPRLSEGLRRFLALTTAERRAMGVAARAAVEPFDVPVFLERWRQIYAEQPHR